MPKECSGLLRCALVGYKICPRRAQGVFEMIEVCLKVP
jgi:hypothetical protein